MLVDKWYTWRRFDLDIDFAIDSEKWGISVTGYKDGVWLYFELNFLCFMIRFGRAVFYRNK